MKNLLMLVIFLALGFVNSFSQMDKDKLFDELKADYSNLNSLSLNFTLNENASIKGELISQKGNKYVLTIGNRKIYSDGETIWNYVPENKNVLVSKFETHGESASIEKIFFQFTQNFKPVKLYKSQSASGKSNTILELIPIGEATDDITMVKLEINPDTRNIYQISIFRNYAEESWKISNLKINPKIADSKFVFVPQENVEIIDLR
jgi:outer membrane lipoprotein carrier protein